MITGIVMTEAYERASSFWSCLIEPAHFGAALSLIFASFSLTWSWRQAGQR